MSLFSAKDYARENKGRIGKKRTPKSAIDPTRKKRDVKKCSLCQEDSITELRQGKQIFNLCEQHKKQFEDKNTDHAVVFQKYSLKK